MPIPANEVAFVATDESTGKSQTITVLREEKKVIFTVTDAATEEQRTVTFTQEKNGVAVSLQGCSTVTDEDVIFIEYWNGEPRVHVWTDKNSSQPTVISLKGTM